MLFHLGGLWRPNELAYLPKLARISSVSGGLITAGVLALHWSRLSFVNDVATGFVEEVVTPIRAMADETIDVGDVLKGIFLPGTIATRSSPVTTGCSSTARRCRTSLMRPDS